jgi:hypothetical protein
MKGSGKKIAFAVVTTANLSSAHLHRRRLRRLQTSSIVVSGDPNEDSSFNETVPPYVFPTFPSPNDLSLSYLDDDSSIPILLQLEDQNNVVNESHSEQEHISASSDVENDHDIMVTDAGEASATVSQTETHQDSEGFMRQDQFYAKSGKVSKFLGDKSNKSSNSWYAGNHSGKPTHAPLMHTSYDEWWHPGHSGSGKSDKSTNSRPAPNKHTSEKASYNWNLNPIGKATKLFKPKSSGWWPPHPDPSKMPTPSSPPSFYPPLTWEGVNGCTPESQCRVCAGDCDSNEDCMLGLECFKRSGSEHVPGCTSGGKGDIPGADYCYDPKEVSPVLPTATPISPTPSPSNESLPVLQWKGVNGCTPTSPCGVCQGDCDENNDCLSGFECFKRSDGEYTQVPGCAVGGSGDIAGADYCYDPSSLNPPSYAPTKIPTGMLSSVPPATGPPVTGSPTRTIEAFFIQSQAKTPTIFASNRLASLNHGSNGSRGLQQDSSQYGWCVSGALAPDYYQLLLEECKPNSSSISTSNSFRKVEQMDQLWSMDSKGRIHSIFNYERCMMVSSLALQFESPIEIGPCSEENAQNQFYYDTSFFPYTLKLQGRAYASMCVTFLGDESSRGAEMVLGPCENEAKFGWDFIPESSLGNPTIKPTSSLPKLRYLGRDACTADSPCGACHGDCDTNEDCNNGLKCFQRERGDSTQVPGCAVGGAGDIPGADYCYDPKGPVPPTPELPRLEWLGPRGCSVERPCPICSGDCDIDGDCQKSLSCFKREIGGDASVPGCAVGGLGDIPGGDYCYDPNQKTNTESTTNEESQPTLVTTPNTDGHPFSSSQGTPDTNDPSFSNNDETLINPAKPGVTINDNASSSSEGVTTSSYPDGLTTTLTPAPTPVESKSSKASPAPQKTTATSNGRLRDHTQEQNIQDKKDPSS